MQLKLANFCFMFMLNAEVETGVTCMINTPLLNSTYQSQESDLKMEWSSTVGGLSKEILLLIMVFVAILFAIINTRITMLVLKYFTFGRFM